MCPHGASTASRRLTKQTAQSVVEPSLFSISGGPHLRRAAFASSTAFFRAAESPNLQPKARSTSTQRRTNLRLSSGGACANRSPIRWLRGVIELVVVKRHPPLGETPAAVLQSSRCPLCFHR